MASGIYREPVELEALECLAAHTRLLARPPNEPGCTFMKIPRDVR
jgi:hypothetical protein